MIPPIMSPTNPPIVFKSRTKENDILKLYKQGKIPLERGAYGDKLDIHNVSREHVLPKSKGGTYRQGNIMLTSKRLNNARGNRPLKEVFNPSAFDEYCSVMEKVFIKGILDGKKYVKELRETVDRCLKRGL